MNFNSANTCRFDLAIAQLTHDDLRVVQFQHTESLSELYRLELEFISENHFLASEQLLNHSARLSLIGEQDAQYVNGIILSAQCQEIGTRFARYAITIVPRVWLLKYRKACRIFQNQSVPEIVQTLLNEAGLVENEHFSWSIDRTYPQRTYCVQYNETQWDFISRLFAEEGIHFHFQHTDNQHQMVIGDSKTAFSLITGDNIIPYRSQSGLIEEQAHINRFEFSHQLVSNNSSYRDYNFKTPNRSLQAVSHSATQNTLEYYDYPGLYTTESEGRFYAELKQQQHQVNAQTGYGIANVQAMRAGHLFTLAQHRFRQHNIPWLITRITHYGEQPQSLDEDTPASISNSQYYNEFYTIPADVPFRPQNHQQKPLIHGQQYAFVTGPDGEEIYLNEYGQIKVQFLWDREGQQDENTTCWIRVNNEIAGKNWGQIMPPRIGQLVLVEFEQGNPDRPVISGRLYHGDSLPPYALPQHKTRSTTKSHSTPNGNGYNEIRFEDKKSQEQIYFHAQKDLDIRCKNDKRETIGNTRSLIVENNQYEHIKNDQHQKIEKILQQQVGSQISEQVGQTKHIKVGDKYLQSAGNEIHIKSTNTILEAGSEITFKASGGFIKIDTSGVVINGITVNLNGDGSASSAASAAPHTPTPAVEADKNKPGQSFKPIEPEQAYKLSEVDFSSINNLKPQETEKKELTELYFSYIEPPKPEVHTVKSGETLSEIAQKYDTSYQRLAELNGISKPYIIYPEQNIIISLPEADYVKDIKLQGSHVPLGTKLKIIANGTPNTPATIEVRVDDQPFKIITSGQETNRFDIILDDNGQSVTEVELRPKSDNEYKQLINDYSPKIGQTETRYKLSLYGEVRDSGNMSSLENDDMNTLGLNLFQLYIKSAYVVNPTTGQVHTKLKASQQGNELVFTDAQTGEPVAKTSMDEFINGLDYINSGLGGLVKGMEYMDGTFAIRNSKGFYLKHYESGWAGNQYVKTYSMSKWASHINNGTVIISVAVGAYQLNSAYQTDSYELSRQYKKDITGLEGIGQHTEQQIGSIIAGVALGTVIGLIALPAEAGILITMGIFITVSSATGIISSWIGEKAIETIHDQRKSTIINNYPIHKHTNNNETH